MSREYWPKGMEPTWQPDADTDPEPTTGDLLDDLPRYDGSPLPRDEPDRPLRAEAYDDGFDAYAAARYFTDDTAIPWRSRHRNTDR